ncbi:MAG: alpha/beta hydrolase [Rhodospirillaceae bacterium]
MSGALERVVSARLADGRTLNLLELGSLTFAMSRAKWLRSLLVAAISLLVTVAGCSQLAQKERELVFRIEPGIAGWYSGLPSGVEEIEIPVNGDQHMHAWWWPAARANAPAVLYLHGSRWNLTGQLFRIAQLHDFGFSVVAIDYRGFGKSKGDLPSEETVYQDAQAAWARLVALQPDPSRRYIYGHSLGGAVAVDLAYKLARLDGAPHAAGLVVESSFTTLGDVAEVVVNTRWPIRWLLSQKFDSVQKIADVRVPVLFVHGTEDRHVPARFSETLYAAAASPKKLLFVEGGTHNNSMRHGSVEYRAALRELFGLPL